MAAGLTPGELRQLEAICLKLATSRATLVVASHKNGDMLL